MRSILKGATIVYVDIYAIKYDLIVNSNKYGKLIRPFLFFLNWYAAIMINRTSEYKIASVYNIWQHPQTLNNFLDVLWVLLLVHHLLVTSLAEQHHTWAISFNTLFFKLFFPCFIQVLDNSPSKYWILKLRYSVSGLVIVMIFMYCKLLNASTFFVSFGNIYQMHWRFFLHWSYLNLMKFSTWESFLRTPRKLVTFLLCSLAKLL